MKMFIMGDYDNAIDLTRRCNTLGPNAKTFMTTAEARSHAYGLNANEAGHDEQMQGDARSRAETARRRASSSSCRYLSSCTCGQRRRAFPDVVPALCTRSKDLAAALYAEQEESWTRLSKAASAQKAHSERLQELRERHQKAAEGQPSIAPRTVAAPSQPSAEERAMHDLLHMTPAAYSWKSVGKAPSEVNLREEGHWRGQGRLGLRLPQDQRGLEEPRRAQATSRRDLRDDLGDDRHGHFHDSCSARCRCPRRRSASLR